MSYRLQCNFGTELHTGTKVDCKIIKQAMIKYGIKPDKLEIVAPEWEDFRLPEDLAGKIYIALHDYDVCGRDYSSYISEEVQGELNELSDYELYQTYKDYKECDYGVDEYEDRLIRQAEQEYNSFLAEKEIFK